MTSEKFWEEKTGLGNRNFSAKLKTAFESVDRIKIDPIKLKKYEISDDYKKL